MLFGSYARDDWVEDRIGGYFSDFDLLVVVDQEEYAKQEYWYRADDRLSQEYVVTKRIKTPVEPIVHSIHDVNTQLQKGRPFFLDILHDGIVLYDGGNYTFVKPGKMTDEEKQAESARYFKEWYSLAQAGLANAKFSFSQSTEEMDGHMRYAAFLAHQTTEQLYHCVLLTLKLYSPKMHNIRKLRDLAEGIAPDLIEVWPRNTKEYRRTFELLRRAYVEARYSPHYAITPEELEWLFERIAYLQKKVKAICEAHLAAGAGQVEGN